MDPVSGTLPSQAPTNWPWLNPMVAAWLLAIFLGLISLAAVREMAVGCRDEPIGLALENGGCLMLEDGSGCLALEQKRRQCRVVFGQVGISLYRYD
jgi:hypothetical protein